MNVKTRTKAALPLAALLLAAALFSGCSRIPEYSLDESALSESGEQSEQLSEEGISDSYSPSSFSIIKQNFLTKLNAEGGVFENGAVRTDGEFDGKGYVRLLTGGKLTHIVKANTPQLYRIVIAARSEEGASIKLFVKKKSEGSFYIPPTENAEESASEESSEGALTGGFSYYAVDTVYLTEGSNVIDMTVEKGSADIDYILAENSDAVSGSCYKTGTSSVNPSAGIPAVGVIKYFSEIYGRNTLAAVNTSLATNAEIDAVYKATGRYPAIRCGELAPVVFDDEESTEKIKTEAELALEWGKSGGIVSYKWHWYSPNTRRSVDSGAFDLEDALKAPNLDQIAVTDSEDLKALVENNYLSANTLALINDIDKAALFLGLFNNEDIPVVFEPVPNGDSGLYWWGDGAELHKELYTLIFDRLCRYHKLSNLIFVWTGSSAEYYPGASCCDLIGQTIFENSNASFAGRLSTLSEAFPTKKPLCVTARDVLPGIDISVRDNALWLWTALAAGKYIIGENGALSAEYNSLTALNNAYNSELYITRDELPALSEYALS